jgi:hypothetical protein
LCGAGVSVGVKVCHLPLLCLLAGVRRVCCNGWVEGVVQVCKCVLVCGVVLPSTSAPTNAVCEGVTHAMPVLHTWCNACLNSMRKPPVTMCHQLHQLRPNSALARQLQCLSSNILIIINTLNTPGFSEFKKTPWWLGKGFVYTSSPQYKRINTLNTV